VCGATSSAVARDGALTTVSLTNALDRTNILGLVARGRRRSRDPRRLTQRSARGRLAVLTPPPVVSVTNAPTPAFLRRRAVSLACSHAVRRRPPGDVRSVDDPSLRTRFAPLPALRSLFSTKHRRSRLAADVAQEAFVRLHRRRMPGLSRPDGWSRWRTSLICTSGVVTRQLAC
jgi:hypothetical protein